MTEEERVAYVKGFNDGEVQGERNVLYRIEDIYENLEILLEDIKRYNLRETLRKEEQTHE